METRHSTRVSARTRPQRTSWGVWALVGVLGFGSADAGGAGPGAYAVGVDAIACAGTFLMSLHPGLGKPGGRRTDLVLGVAALAGVVLWRGGPLSTSGAAVVAVSCEAVALWPTLREGWRRPGLESLPSWALTWSATGCASRRSARSRSRRWPTRSTCSARPRR